MLLSTTFSLRMIDVYYDASVASRIWSTYVVRSYAVPHNIVFNCKKSVGVLFPFKGFVLSQSSKIVLGNKLINFSDSVTYLGVKISANLSDDENIFHQVRSIYCAANKLKSKGEFTQYPFFVRFCPFLCIFFFVRISSVHIHTNQAVTYWAKVFRNKLFVKGSVA